MLIKGVLVSLSFLSFSVNASFTYDNCNNILREGVRDDLASNNSKKHQLVKHQQFCSIAKEYKLSDSNFDSFARDYAKKTSSKISNAGGSAGVSYGLFGADADYGQSSQSGTSSEDDRINSLKKKKLEILDYFQSNCGSSAYQEMLEEEAHLTTRIVNKDIVEAWAKCMINRNSGTFAYPILEDEDMYQFGVHVMYQDVGTRHLKSVKVRWVGDNLSVLTAPDNIHKLNSGHETGELLDEGEVIYSGGDHIIDMVRTDNTKNDKIRISTVTGDGVKRDFSFTLPKFKEIQIDSPSPLPMPTVNPNSKCARHQARALTFGYITEEQYRTYVLADLAPIPAVEDWSLVAAVPCASFTH